VVGAVERLFVVVPLHLPQHHTSVKSCKYLQMCLSCTMPPDPSLLVHLTTTLGKICFPADYRGKRPCSNYTTVLDCRHFGHGMSISTAWCRPERSHSIEQQRNAALCCTRPSRQHRAGNPACGKGGCSQCRLCPHTWAPMWVQTAEHMCSLPSLSLYTAALCRPCTRQHRDDPCHSPPTVLTTFQHATLAGTAHELTHCLSFSKSSVQAARPFSRLRRCRA